MTAGSFEVNGHVHRILKRQSSDASRFPGVRYIHVRNTEAGCFIARIERLQANGHVL